MAVAVTRLGHYRILEPIGAGGMGVVYRARDERLEREVALKVLHQTTLGDEVARKRFRREALALSRLNHPNIATIHDFDSFDGVDVLVMEYIPGSGLDDLLERGPLPEGDIIRLGQQLMTALQVAHERGVVHRDLKPGNLRVTPDRRLKVLDFGLARALLTDTDARTVTATQGTLAGTVPYMAPEQIRGEPIDERTDIYAAGAVLFEMATGGRVHGGLSGTPLIGAILENTPPPASRLNPQISNELDRIISKALDKDPQLRYQSARELSVDLDRLAAPRSSVTARPARPVVRGRGVTTALVAAVLVLTGWLAYREWPRNGAIQPRGWIMVADFEDGTDDAGLAEAIREGLTVQLQQSRHVNVLSREQMFDALRRMRRAEQPTLDTATARELALREDIPLLLAGSIQRRGDITRVESRGVDVASQAVLFAEMVQFRQDDEAFDSIDVLARRVRRQLGESVRNIEERSRPLAKVTTGSLPALKQYSHAADALARGDADRALPLLQAALRLSPDFAMAHRLLARVYETLGNEEQTRAHLAHAHESRESLTERERLHVEASYLKGQREFERAVSTLQVLTALYPGDGEARYELALAYRDAGDLPKAVQELEGAIVDAPFVTVAYGDLVLLLARRGEYARAEEIYTQAARRDISAPRLTWGHGMVLFGQGRSDEAREEFQRLVGAGDVLAGTGRLYLAAVDMYEGRLASAVRQLESGILLDQRSENMLAELKRRALLSRIGLIRGDLAQARHHVDRALRAGPEALGPENLSRFGGLAIRSGDQRQVPAMLARLETLRGTVSSAFVESCYFNLLGEIALAERRYDRAAEAFQSAATHYARPASTLGLARAYSGKQDWDAARREWLKVLDWKGELLHEGFAADWVLTHMELARIERRAGDLDAARRYGGLFVDLWRHGDSVPAWEAAVAGG